MKLLALLLACLYMHPNPSLLIVDMNGKKPVHVADSFSEVDYLLRNFPVYADDLSAVVTATEAAARRIDRTADCGGIDTIRAQHTLVITKHHCEQGGSVSVRLVTQLPEAGFQFDYELVRNQSDRRKAQRQLLDFSTYLSR